MSKLGLSCEEGSRCYCRLIQANFYTEKKYLFYKRISLGRVVDSGHPLSQKMLIVSSHVSREKKLTDARFY
jgi:hypothetical protein